MKPIIQGHGKGDGKTELTSIISKHTTVRQYTKNYNGVKKGTLDSNPKIIQGSLPPAVFYVPHQDDDALAMSLAIREHIEAGRRVIVHLYSDGINTQLRDIVSGTAPCPLQHPPHQFNLTLQDVVTGRTHEFRQSLHALGVQDEDILETGWSDIEPVKDYITFKAKVKSLILGYETKYPGASHKCISGEYDRDSFGRNPTHRACWDVATELLDQYPFGWPSSGQVWDFRFYRTYTYYRPEEARTAQFIRALPQYLPYKQRSLDQYKRWDPSNGELAWGYHSVKFLIDAAYYDPYVYVDMLANDPTNPENLAGVVNLRRIQSGQGRTMFPNAWKKKTQTLKDMNKQSSKNRKQSPREKKPKQHKQHTHQAPTEGQEEGVGQDQEHVLLQQHVVDHKVTSTQPKWAQVERLPKISKQRQGSKDALWEKAEQDLAKEILRKFDEAMMSEGLSYDYSKARKRPIVVGLV
ncbi:hypothetical protein BGW38_002762 [Lunasporangiospora selenospora]|uniref:N-acetylglucosaminylphosphatidylinositol deacetylase n=1 Tax=Lunasporangiospora selenospora TaxID=979761 RepID=A0A9P6G3I8_9FUNG|nr:hypothetical protein BGW38_002762 [Lunasporangiospora selenospora]